jgi:hypothetical protein
MPTLSKVLAKLLLLIILLSPAVQVHADHDSGGSNLQSMLSVVLKADSDVHDETLPHEDTTATGADGCTDHPAEIQAMTTCHTGAQISVQAVAALTTRIASFQIGADGKAPSFFAMREGTSSRELPPAHAGGLHEFQLMLSGVLPPLVLYVPSNDVFVHSDGGNEVTV